MGIKKSKLRPMAKKMVQRGVSSCGQFFSTTMEKMNAIEPPVWQHGVVSKHVRERVIESIVDRAVAAHHVGNVRAGLTKLSLEKT